MEITEQNNYVLIKKMMKKICYIKIMIIILTCMSCSKDDDGYIKVGVFGGSVSSTQESEIAKDVWRAAMNIEVDTYGVGGAGFSNTTTNCIPEQIFNAPICDVYILWASTNDFKKGKVGEMNSMDLSTQSGGIRESVRIIREKAPQAQILFFISMHRFDQSYMRMIPFIDGQKKLCNFIGISSLDQSQFFDQNNYKPYYYDDKVHLNRDGYRKIAAKQLEFLKKNILIK